MINEIKKRRVIPVIVLEKEESAKPLAEALLNGGIDIIEITFRTSAAAKSIEIIRKEFPEMLTGAGTVVTPEQAQKAIDCGVQFGLAPGLNPDTVSFFKEKDTLFIPGVMTPSEIEQGISLGCEVLKFFPAEAAGGLKMLNALAGPYASLGIQFCPTGGVNLNNMNDYLANPLVSNIGGTWIATKQQIADGDWTAITKRAKEAVLKLG